MIKLLNKIVITLGFVALLGSSFSDARGIDRGELLASMCVTCHGPEGQGSKRIPPLDNHSVQEFVEYMNGFKTGEERATIMDRHAKAYSNEEILLLANYFYRPE